MSLELEEKQMITNEFNKIAEIILYLSEITGATENSPQKTREYLSNIGLAIYQKMM